MTRRTFLKHSLVVTAALSQPGMINCLTTAERRLPPLRTRQPKSGAVVWYSQTGHTRRYGRLIAAAWKKRGLQVYAADYRECDPAALRDCDVIAVGSPVYYYEAPANFRSWLAALPILPAPGVAAYATFGGEGGNQHNAACSLLEVMSSRGAVPVGMDLFGNMSTFAPTWSVGNEARILAYRHTPNEETYRRVRAFADGILEKVGRGAAIAAERKSSFRNVVSGSPSIWGTQLLIGNHAIDRKRCIQCGACRRACPVGAIDIASGKIDTGRCVACLGCVNNCPNQAMGMTIMGKRVYGFREFLRKNNIVIAEPAELAES